MNTHRFLAVLLCGGLLYTGCGGFYSPPAYTPELPPLPETWAQTLPPPRWRIEWLGADGGRQTLDAGAQGGGPLEFPREYPSPVLAFPYWPELNLPPGILRPAGAVYPFDLEGGRLPLSWRGGVTAWVWRELDAAAHPAYPQRRSELFDWPRFRQLLEDEELAEEIRRDPWLADWESFCQTTIQSGFDRRRIKVKNLKELVIPGFQGPWIGSSPFADPLPGNPLRLKAGETPESFISAGGILRCTGSAWIWLPWQSNYTPPPEKRTLGTHHPSPVHGGAGVPLSH